MSDRLAQLFVEISAKNMTGPEFAKVKKDLGDIASSAKKAGDGWKLQAQSAATEISSMMQKMGGGTTGGGQFGAMIAGLTGTPAATVAAMMQQMGKGTGGGPGLGIMSGMAGSGSAGAVSAMMQQMGMGSGGGPGLGIMSGMAGGRAASEVSAMMQQMNKGAGATGQWGTMITGMSKSAAEFMAQQKKAADDLLKSQNALQASAQQLSDTWGQARRNAYILTYAAAALGGAVAGAAAAASPAVWHTFTGSIQEAAAAVGTAFTPALVELSYKIQQFGDWFYSLDQTTRENIGTWVLWGVGLFTAATAVVMLARVIGAFVSVIFTLNAAMKYLTISTTAMNMSLLSTTGTAAAAAGAFGRLAASITAAGIAMRAFVLSNPVTAAILLLTTLLAAMNLLPNLPGSDAEGGVQGSSGIHIPGSGGLLDAVVNHLLPHPVNVPGSGGLINAALNNMPGIGALLAIRRIGEDTMGTEEPQRALRTNIRFQSQAMRPEDVWQQIQTAVLSETPHDQRMMEIQSRSMTAVEFMAARMGRPQTPQTEIAAPNAPQQFPLGMGP